jgi:hypothetical protein
MRTIKNNILSQMRVTSSTGPATKEYEPNEMLFRKTRTSIKIRSRDALDQKMKPLTKIEKRYPLLTPYIKSANNLTATFSIYSERGVPSFIFIFAERQYDGVVEHHNTHPIITGVDFFGRTNNQKTLCNYLFDEHEIWHATRRNSNIGVDLNKLRTVGGVLLSREDLGTLERDDFEDRDCFDYDIKVRYKDETTLAPVIALGVEITLVTIFENGIFLTGANGQMTFAEERRY